MKIFLTTERLTLTIPQLNDIDEVSRLQSDPEVMKYIGAGIRSKATVRSFLDMAIAHYAKHGFSFCSLREKLSNVFIGQAGLIYLGYDDNQPNIEVGYRLHKNYWGKGYATELTSALMLWAFQYLSIPKLMAVAHLDNKNSQNVLIKSGMINTGTIDYWGKEVLCFEITSEQCLPNTTC